MKRVLEFTPEEVEEIIRNHIINTEGWNTSITFQITEHRNPVGDQPTGIYSLTKVIAREVIDV